MKEPVKIWEIPQSIGIECDVIFDERGYFIRWEFKNTEDMDKVESHLNTIGITIK